MSDFNITAPRLPSTVNTVSSTAITATVPDPPRQFANLDNGTILRGTVQGRDKDGLLTIKTDQGLLAIATNANLQAGSQVTLEVRAIGDRLQVVVLSAEAPGQALSPPALPQTGIAAPATPSTAPPAMPPARAQAPQNGAPPQPVPADNPDIPAPGANTAAPAPEAPRPTIVIAGSTLTAVVVQALPKDLLSAIDPQESMAGGLAKPAVTLQQVAGLQPTASQSLAHLPLTALPGPSLIPEIRDKLEALFFGEDAVATAKAGTMPGGVTPPTTTGSPMPSSLPPASLSILNPTGLQQQSLRTGQTGALMGQAGAQPQPGQPGAGAGSLAAGGNAMPVPVNAGAATHLLTGTLASADQTTSGPGGSNIQNGALPSGTEVKLQVLGIQDHPGETLDLPLGAASGKSALLGQIIGHTPSGRPVIHTPAGDLILHQKMTLPTGAKILMALELIDGASTIPMAQPSPTPQLAAFNLARGWPSLAELLMLLQSAEDDGPATGKAPADLAAALNLPQPGPRLGAGLAAAIEAFRSGNFEKLFGPLGEAVKAAGGRSDALRKLRDDFQQVSLLAQDSNAQDWRCFFLPLWDDGQLQQINLFYRRPRRGQKDTHEKDDAGARFVVEVNFSRLGACQLDGLVGKGRFDLMVRSHRDLPEAARREISGLFAQAREIGNYAGEVTFQTAARFPVAPLEDVAKVPPGVVA